METWKRSECGYFIYKRDYKISAASVRGNWKYSAWHRRDLLGVFISVDDAKRAVEIHEAGHFPHEGIATNESATI